MQKYETVASHVTVVMEINTHHHQGNCDITLSGQFTFNDHPAFREILQLMSDEAISKIVLHMAKVRFVDSAALGMLLLALDEAGKTQTQLVISGVTGQVKKMFEMARFNTLFTMN